MSNFLIGSASSLVATFLVYLITVYGWPALNDKVLYRGVRVDGIWEIVEERNGQSNKVGKIELKQIGRIITGESHRSINRDGKSSNRQFTYRGSIHGNQVTLIYEDKKGVGFDTGSYIFIVRNDVKKMIGMATFNGKRENKIISESRTLKRVLE